MRKSLAFLSAGVLAFAALAFAPTAQAALPPECIPRFSVTPAQYRTDTRTVALGFVPRAVTFNVALTVAPGIFNACPTVSDWELEAGDDVNGAGDRNLYVHVRRSSPVAVLDSSGLDNADAGNVFQVSYWFVAGGNWYINTETLAVKRATMFTGFNASPEPVTQGNQILAKGTLLRANWDARLFIPYAGRTLKYQNRDALGGGYTVRRTHPSAVVTDNVGRASGSRRADITRVHRFAFYGNGTSGASAAYGDYVAVTP